MSRLSVFRSRFFWKIYATFSILFLSITLLVSWIVFARIQASLQATTLENLKEKVVLLTPYAEEAFNNPEENFEELFRDLGHASKTRITLIKPNGEVMIESDISPNQLDNHWQRPEIQQSLLKPWGTFQRHSASTQVHTLYVAQALKAGPDEILGVLRVAIPMTRLDKELVSIRWAIIFIVVCGAFIALALGWWLARRVTGPITEMVQVAESMRLGRYDQKVKILHKDEIGRLGDTLNRLGHEITKQISELKRLETVRRDFVANVSHEIKTPLTSIKGYVETLISGDVEPDLHTRFLEKISRNTDRLSALVQDLLSLAKIESQEGRLSLMPTDWNPIVSSVVGRQEDVITRKDLKIKIDEQYIPLRVVGDKEAMTQVIDNLLTNAIKYTPDGGRITISLTASDKHGLITVEDTGIGIPNQHIDRIFERFYRIDKARSRDLGGTGLGLSIVKHLVASMNGEVTVASRVGVGSIFTVQLPLES